MKIYLIVECNELSDQYECDANRIPRFVLINPSQNELDKFKEYGWEIYAASTKGVLDKIQDYDRYPYEEEEEEN